MKKIRFDCPTDFISRDRINNFLKERNLTVDNVDPSILIVNPGTDTFLDANHFIAFKNLQVVGTPSTGVNHIDTMALNKRNIKAFCLLDDRQTLENIHASAEFTWIHIMNAMRKFTLALENVSNWREKTNEDLLRSNELAEKKIGIIGLGRIGRKIAKYATAFSMEVFYYDPYVQNEKYSSVNSIEELRECDVISINCYLTDETKDLITFNVFNGFKNNLIVVNSSRGEVVDEDYILELIQDERIIYSCDVLKNEQDIEVLKKSKLINLKSDRLTITPHVAGATIESQYKAFMAIINLCSNYISSV